MLVEGQKPLEFNSGFSDQSSNASNFEIKTLEMHSWEKNHSQITNQVSAETSNFLFNCFCAQYSFFIGLYK